MSTGSPASAAGDDAASGPVEDEDSYREVPLFSRNVASALNKLKLVSSDVIEYEPWLVCFALVLECI